MMIGSGSLVGANTIDKASNGSDSNAPLASKTIYMPDSYTKIQWAVDNATAGDTIIVRDDTYSENVKVNKRLTIKSTKIKKRKEERQ